VRLRSKACYFRRTKKGALLMLTQVESTILVGELEESRSALLGLLCAWQACCLGQTVVSDDPLSAHGIELAQVG